MKSIGIRRKGDDLAQGRCTHCRGPLCLPGLFEHVYNSGPPYWDRKFCSVACGEAWAPGPGENETIDQPKAKLPERPVIPPDFHAGPKS